MTNQYKLILLVVAGVLVGGYSILLFDKQDDAHEPESTTEVVENKEPLSDFVWRFGEASTNNLDGNPQTEVFLAARYGEAGGEEDLIDTVDGSCSELEGESYEGEVSDTTQVQCYYAGLGQRYRIIKASDSYLVERKLFEEALPDVTAPEYEWEVISSFPLQK